MKVLCIMNQNIYHAKSGGGQCALRNYTVIQRIMKPGDKLFTCIIADDFFRISQQEQIMCVPGVKSAAERVVSVLVGNKCYGTKYEKDIWKFIDMINPDVVYLDTSKLGKLIPKIKKRHGSRVICFFHNVEADYSYNWVIHRGFPYLLSYWASKWNEEKVVKYADHTICLTKRDAERIKELYGKMPDSIIPISFEDKYRKERVRIDNTKGLLFVGSCFPPNYDGIKWFIEQIMSKLPQEKLTVVGKGFEEERESLKRNNVVIQGTVEDLEEYYYTYPIVVMPIQYGAGMKVKMAEAMMYNKIILATDEALEGYEIDGNRGIFRCNTAEEFINTINNIQRGNIKICPESREVFLKRYENGIIENQFRELIKL